MLTVPPERTGGKGDRLIILDTRPPEVSVELGGADAGKKTFDLKELTSPMEVADYITYTKNDSAYSEDYEIRKAVTRHGDGKVLKSLDLRPPSRGVDAWLLRKYLLGACAVEVCGDSSHRHQRRRQHGDA